MGFSEQIGGIYSGIEEKFYGAMDFLADKGVPVYAAIDPLEESGIPALPVAFAALLIIIFLLLGTVFLAAPSVTVGLSLTDSSGSTLSGVALSVSDYSSGEKIEGLSDIVHDGQELDVPRGIGAKIVLQASKQGYETPAPATVTLKSKAVQAQIVLKKISVRIGGKIRLVDDAGNPIEGAAVVARLSDTSEVPCEQTATKGEYSCVGVAAGEKTRVTITSPNYEQKSLDVQFLADSPSEIALAAKAIALQGSGNLIVRAFDAGTKKRAGNFTVQAYDAKEGTLISETTETDGDGEQVLKISNGTAVRLVIKADKYITYNSSDVGENFTQLPPEVRREIYLRPGTNALVVGVLDATGRPLPSINVNLFSETGEALGSKRTELAGEVTFENLSTGKIYYVSAWDEQYLPAKQRVDLSRGSRASLVLLRGTAQNSGSLDIYTANETGAPLNDVSLNFFLDDENGLRPLGVPAQKSDITGRFTLLSPLNSTIVVKAAKGALEGQQSVKILETFKNEAFITLREPFSQVTLKVLDKDGKEAQKGFVSVTGGKDVLLEGEYSKGLVFNPKGNDYVTVSYSDDAGNAFEEEAYAKDVNEIVVSPKGAKSSGTAPDAEFLGVFNIDGTKAEGLAKGVDYFLKFRANYSPGTNKNGFHARLGDDTVNFVDSQDAGIIGFSATGAGAFYGRSYSPNPAPGFEALDFENSGTEGKFSKWLELYFQSYGEKIIKVRVKAKETATAPNIEAHYRAWSAIGSSVYRTPADSELKLAQFSPAKTSLYAETKLWNVRILEASAQCKNDLCASYKFVRSDGSEYKPGGFKAVLGELYALDVTLSPSISKTVTIKASTAKQNPKIGFQGFGIDSYAQFPDSNSQDTSLQVDNVSALPSQGTSVRLFFKAFRTENSSITLQLISGETVINEQFYFDIFREKAISLKTAPDNVAFGEDFAINLQDEERNGIANAQISISDSSGKRLATIPGNNTANKGAGGRYLVKNTFGAGTLKYTIGAAGYKPLDGTIEVTKSGILKFSAEKAYVSIQKNVRSSQGAIDLANTSRLGVAEITFEVKPVSPLPAGMEIKATPFSNIQGNTSQRISIVGQYSGELASAHGEAIITARGKTDAGFIVTAQTRAIVDYNPKISQDCLQLSKERIAIYVASGMEDRSHYDQQYNNYSSSPNFQNSLNGNFNSQQYNNQQYGSSSNNRNYQNSPGRNSYYRYNNFSTTSSDTFTAKLVPRPECQVPLELKAQSVAQGGTASSGIEVQSGDIRLNPVQGLNLSAQGTAAPGTTPDLAQAAAQIQGPRSDTQEVTVTVTNNMVRNYPSSQKFGFDVVYSTDGFARSMPVDVYVWNPSYALQVTRNIELFLGPNDQGVYSAQVPLFVQNIGQADIENIDFRLNSTTSRGNTDIQIIPPYPVQFLRKGEQIFPPKTLVAQVQRNEKTTLDEVKQLDITGVINGQTFNFGPVLINLHVSAAQCLVVTPSNIVFYSKNVEQQFVREITVRNTCAEEVRILDISKSPIGRNTLSLNPVGGILPPHSQAKYNLILDGRESYQSSALPVRVKSLLIRSGAPLDSNPIFVEIRLGKDTGRGEAASEQISIPVCEGGPNKSVRFPKIASGTNALCDNSYCDSQQLSGYLADRINEAVVDAEKQITNRSSQIQRSDCDQQDIARGFCRFSDFGVKLKPFSVYMSQDNISAGLLQRALEQKQGAVKGFRVDYLQGRDAGEYLGGYSRQVFMNSNFRACGAYTVSLDGSVRVEGSRIVPELMNVLIDVQGDSPTATSGRQLTEQCLARVQNINNFLPRDEGLSPNSRLDTWLGVVETKEKALGDISKDVAKTIFGSDQRSVSGSQGSNVLSLSLGADQGYLVRIDMDKVESESPVTVRAHIREAVGTDEKLQGQIAKEAGQIIKNLRDNQIEGCIGSDESYLLLKSSKGDFGTVRLDAKGEIPVQYKNASCVDFNVTSDIKETIGVSARKVSQTDGITSDSPFLKQGLPAAGQTQGAGFVESNLRPQTLDVKIDRLDAKSNRFIGAGRVCVVGSAQLQNAQGKAIAIEAKRNEGKGKAEEPKELQLKVCGIHPYRFIAEAAEKMKAPTKAGEYYYATFIWKGSPDQLTLGDLSKLTDIRSLADKAKLRADNKIEPTGRDTPEIASAKTKAATTYLAVCSVTSATTSFFRPVIGVAAGIFNVLFDCMLPWSYMMFGETDTFKNITGIINKALEVLGPIKAGIDSVLGALGTAMRGAFKLVGITGFDSAQNNLTNLAQNPQSFNTNVVDAMVPAAVIKDSILAAQRTFGSGVYGGSVYRSGGLGLELSKSQMVAKNVAGSITDHITESAFGGHGNSFTEKLGEILTEDIKTNFTKAELGKAPIRGSVLSDAEIQKAITEAIDKAGKDNDVLKELYNNKKVLTGELKAVNIEDDLIETLSKDMKLEAADYGTRTFNVQAQSTGTLTSGGNPDFQHVDDTRIRTSLGGAPTELTKLESTVIAEAKQKLASNLGIAVADIPPALVADIDTVKLGYESDLLTKKVGSGRVLEEIPSETKVKVTKDNVDSMVKEIGAKIKNNIRSTVSSAITPVTPYEVSLQKKFGKAGIKKLQFNTEEAKKATNLSVLKPKNWLLMIKNLAKEGAFGLLSNAVGMKAYDWVLKKQLDAIQNRPRVASVQDERARVGVAILGQSFESLDGSAKFTINKYATYRMTVSNATGQQRIAFEYAKDGIPQGTAKELVIEDCKTPGFDQGIGDSLPGLLPDPDKPPRFFTENAKLRSLYPVMVNNYYKNQDNGEMVGALIASASKAKPTPVSADYRTQMNSIGINMEALLASLGAMKTSLGTGVEPQNTFMFGCNLKGGKEQDVFRNAVCAADKLAKSKAACAGGDTTQKLSCLLQKYNADASNQQGNTLGNITPEQFRQLYDSWNAAPLTAGP